MVTLKNLEEVISKIVTSNLLYLHLVFVQEDLHPKNNQLCLLFVKSETDEFIFPFNHSECESLPISILSKLDTCAEKWCPDKKFLMHIYPFQNLKECTVDKITATNTHDFFNIRGIKNNSIIPIYKHVEMIKSEKVRYQSDLFLDRSLNCLFQIESAGLRINDTVIEKYEPLFRKHTNNNYVYCNYNVYTSTGRPSNSFGINFAALNKEDGIRKKFISRFDNGNLVLFDFDAFHLRLIAELIDYNFPKGSVHEYLAKQYFNKSEISHEEYEEAKRISFQALYGHIPDNIQIPFFQKTQILIDEVYEQYLKNREYHFQITNKTFTGDFTKNKLFNYVIQNLEFYRGVYVIEDILNYLKDKQSKLILYTYDSFLIDLHPNESETPIYELISNHYPCRFKKGKDYQEIS